MFQSTLCIAAAATLALNANADLLTFTSANPSFILTATNFDGGDIGQSLDITQPLANQPAFGTFGPAWSVFVNYAEGSSQDGAWQYLRGRTQSLIARSSTPTDMLDGYDGLPIGILGPETFGPGDTIGAAQDWQSSPVLTMRNPFGRWDTVPTTSSYIVGIRIVLSGATHYGFIELETTNPPGSPNFRLYRPLSWGYETTPDTPITIIPAPAGALSLAALGLLARRRR